MGKQHCNKKHKIPSISNLREQQQQNNDDDNNNKKIIALIGIFISAAVAHNTHTRSHKNRVEHFCFSHSSSDCVSLPTDKTESEAEVEVMHYAEHGHIANYFSFFRFFFAVL